MRILILRSVNFYDSENCELINKLISIFDAMNYETAVYNMPSCEDPSHWAGYSIVNYTNMSDLLICLDFPTALIQHNNKIIVLTKELPNNSVFSVAINGAISESQKCYKVGKVSFNCEKMPEDILMFIKDNNI